MAPVLARVGVGSARRGDEPPAVRARFEPELQDAGCADLLDLHARVVRAFLGPARRAARPDDELPYAPIRTFASRSHGGVALVTVGVAAEDHVGVPLVEDGPEAPHPLGAVVASAGGTQRVMKVGQRALRPVLAEVPAEPAPLARIGAAGHLLAVAVEGDDVPAAALVGVVAPTGLPHPRPEVAEVGLRPWGVVVVVARRGLGTFLILAPRGTVAVAELCAGAVGVGIVAEGEDGSPRLAQQPRRVAVGSVVAAGYVSRADQRHRLRLRDARPCRQQGRHARQQHRRGYRTDDKKGLAHPLLLPQRLLLSMHSFVREHIAPTTTMGAHGEESAVNVTPRRASFLGEVLSLRFNPTGGEGCGRLSVGA